MLQTQKKWADENLGPSCSPTNLDLCNDEQKEEIAKYQAMDVAELQEVRIVCSFFWLLWFLVLFFI